MEKTVKMLFKNPKGMFQLFTYNRKAKNYWEKSRLRLVNELYKFVVSSSARSLEDVTIKYADRIGFSELSCDANDIQAFQKKLDQYGMRLITDLINYGANTKLVHLLLAPVLAAKEGIGISGKNVDDCIYAVGLCNPISADMCDCVLDLDIPSHPEIREEDWVISYKVGSASLFHFGQETVQTISEEIIERLNKGVDIVSEAQKLDLKAKTSSHVSLPMIEKIYDGKIGEIEATIFSCIDLLGGHCYPQFERGSLAIANEIQMQDDAQELLGEGGHVRPEIPNPSYFLYYCRENYRNGNRNFDVIMRESALDSVNKGQEYHRNVEVEYNNLESTFSTKPFFEAILYYLNNLFLKTHNRFAQGDTFSILKPELSKLIGDKLQQST